MASEKALSLKSDIVNEIIENIKASQTVILFSYQGLKVSDLSTLRRNLRDTESEIKIYKNTLTKRALEELKIDLDGFMEGPNALLFGKNLLEPIKIISDFAKTNEKLEIRIGIINGDIAELSTIKEYASIPSREGLLTMLAGGMIQYVKELSIGLNLYAEQLNGGALVAETETEEAKEEVVTPEPVEETTTEEQVEQPTEEANPEESVTEEVTETEEAQEEVAEEATEEN